MKHISRMEQIRQALRQNENKEGEFADPNYTIGWIWAIADPKHIYTWMKK